MQIKNFTPCNDWFFVHPEGEEGHVVHRLAGWAAVALADERGNQVVGMISVTGGGNHISMPDVCRLVMVPPVEGTYMHATELEALKSRTRWI